MPKRAREEVKSIPLHFATFAAGALSHNSLLNSSLSAEWVEENLHFDEIAEKSEEIESVESEPDVELLHEDRLSIDSFKQQTKLILEKAQLLLDEREFPEEKPIVDHGFGLYLLKPQNKKEKYEALSHDAYRDLLRRILPGRTGVGREKDLPALAVVYSVQGGSSSSSSLLLVPHVEKSASSHQSKKRRVKSSTNISRCPPDQSIDAISFSDDNSNQHQLSDIAAIEQDLTSRYEFLHPAIVGAWANQVASGFANVTVLPASLLRQNDAISTLFDPAQQLDAQSLVRGHPHLFQRFKHHYHPPARARASHQKHTKSRAAMAQAMWASFVSLPHFHPFHLRHPHLRSLQMSFFIFVWHHALLSEALLLNGQKSRIELLCLLSQLSRMRESKQQN